MKWPIFPTLGIIKFIVKIKNGHFYPLSSDTISEKKQMNIKKTWE